MRSPARIDFLAAAPRRALGLLLLPTAAALFAWQGWSAWQEYRLLDRERSGLAALSRERAPGSGTMAAADRRRHAQLDALARYLAAPWDELFAVFEQRRPGQAIVQRIEQDAATGSVRLTARARHAEAMMDYVTALESDPRLSAVLLHRHEAATEMPGSPLRFELSATWKGGGDLRAADAVAPAASVASAINGARP